MSKAERNKLLRIVAPLALVIGVGATLAGTYGLRNETPARVIVLESRGPAFSGPDGHNPTIEARVGERIRLLLRNSDTGVLHSISVPELSEQVRDVKWGEEGVLEIRLDRPGTFDYTCPQHCPKMRGKLVVRE
jgi:plastocyanin